MHVLHPNPNVGPVVRRNAGLPNVELVEPLDYLALVRLMRRARLILTDSGGIQEEAPTFRKPVLVLREKTERPEGVEAGLAELVGTDEEKIVARASALLSARGAACDERRTVPTPTATGSPRSGSRPSWRAGPSPRSPRPHEARLGVGSARPDVRLRPPADADRAGGARCAATCRPERLLGIRKPPVELARFDFDPGPRAPGRADVLVLPVIAWSYRRQRPQQLAEALARRGMRVFYGSLRRHRRAATSRRAWRRE